MLLFNRLSCRVFKIKNVFLAALKRGSLAAEKKGWRETRGSSWGSLKNSVRKNHFLCLIPFSGGLKTEHGLLRANFFFMTTVQPIFFLSSKQVKWWLWGRGELHSTEFAFLLLTQWLPVQFSAFPKIVFDVAEIYWWRWLEESGQRLENDDRTHLVLARGKLVLKKS